MIDTSFSKNRDTGDKINGINLKLAYWSGAGAIIAVVASKLLGKVGF